MNKKIQFLIAASILVLATLACSFSTSTSTPTPVAPTPIPATPVPTTGTLTVINNSGQTIFYLYVSPSTSTEWGEDVLGAETITAGDSFTLSGIAPGMYDLKAEDSNHNPIDVWTGIDISRTATWEVIGEASTGGTAQLTIINDSGIDIWYAYISPSTSTEWGDDVLGSDTIPAGGSFVVTNIPEGTYDLKVEDSDHNVIETQMGIAMTGEMTWTVIGGGGGGTGTGSTLTIVNNSGRDIWYVFLVPQNSSGWGNDQLGSDTIPSGTTYSISNIPPGMYDIRFNDNTNATIATVNAVNLNSNFTLTLTP